jgi:hypothetical protein
MADTWYYAHADFVRLGPFSGQELRNLADAGSILRTDTVFKTGVEQGMSAAKVKHLFPLVVETPLPVAVELAPIPLVVETPLPVAVELAPIPPLLVTPLSPDPVPAEGVPASRDSKPFQEPPARRRTASAGKGTIMMGQDGTNVRFKKQCTTCQHVDSSSISMRITQGTMKANFFCPKCKKRREVELRGS